MRYEGMVYRPPSEASSLIIQLTIGCARNTCTFCSMYKDKIFRVRDLKEVTEDIQEAANLYGGRVRRVFLADGDALIVKTNDLLYILSTLKKAFANLERITMYGAPRDVLGKTDEELKTLKEAGLDMVYIGAESGDDKVLGDVKKGVTSEEIAQAGIKLKSAGIKVSMTLISGLGGKPKLYDHAYNSAQLISRIKPEYVGFLTLMVEDGTEMYDLVNSGNFELLQPMDIVEELKIFITNVDTEGTVFRANHASNYISLAGTLNKEKGMLLRQIQAAADKNAFRPESYRGL